MDTTKEPINDRYVTLSHRWGDRKFTTLTQNSLPVMAQRGFDASILPTTFRRAVHVAQTLDIRWLWTDCLCILQDSADEFEAQAGLMHKVYGNSYCNISATGAADNWESLFNFREPENLFPLIVELACEGEWDRYYLLDRDLWPRNVTDAPVNRRGWVLQESFLSPRIQHFGKHQLFWECREHQACEAFPDGFPRGMNGARNMQKSIVFRKEQTHKVPDSREAGRRAWRHLLQLYSGCALTDPDGRLTAVPGVAAQVQRALNDDYFADLWKPLLIDGLSWHHDSACVEKKRPGRMRAASWS